MIEGFITKYLLDFALVFLVGLASKFMINKFGEDRAGKIKEAIKDAKDVAVIAASIFLKCGIIKKTKEGFEFSRAWEKYLGLFQNYKYPQ